MKSQTERVIVRILIKQRQLVFNSARDASTRARVLYVHPERARYATYCLWYGNDKNATLNYS